MQKYNYLFIIQYNCLFFDPKLSSLLKMKLLMRFFCRGLVFYHKIFVYDFQSEMFFLSRESCDNLFNNLLINGEFDFVLADKKSPTSKCGLIYFVYKINELLTSYHRFQGLLLRELLIQRRFPFRS